MDAFLLVGVVVQVLGTVVVCWALLGHGRRDGATS